MASSNLKLPIPSTLVVYSGLIKLIATWLCAPKLYISSGLIFFIKSYNDNESVRSP